jgi:hypothetical protein
VFGTDVLVQNQYGEVIRVQVKTTEHPSASQGAFRYPLEVDTFDQLRVGTTPAYLVLVVVHQPHPKWTGHCAAGSMVRATAYWTPLWGLPATTNTSTRTVSLPFENMVTPASLLGLFPEAG